MRTELDKVDAAIAQIAARQHGVVTHTQLVEAGLSRTGVKRRVAAGRLHRVHRGVYAVGHPGLSRHGRWKAAELAGDFGAAVSHRAGIELWELLPISYRDIDITVPNGNGRATRLGLRIHRSHLRRHEWTIHKRSRPPSAH